jgi:hypothetical protein
LWCVTTFFPALIARIGCEAVINRVALKGRLGIGTSLKKPLLNAASRWGFQNLV